MFFSFLFTVAFSLPIPLWNIAADGPKNTGAPLTSNPEVGSELWFRLNPSPGEMFPAFSWTEGGRGLVTKDDGMTINSETSSAGKTRVAAMAATINTAQAYSVEIWVRPSEEEYDGPTRLIAFSKGITGQDCMLGIHDKRRFILRSADGTSGSPDDTRRFDKDEFVDKDLHIVATHSARPNQENATTLVRIYVNGVAELEFEQAMGANGPYEPVLNFHQNDDYKWHVLNENGDKSDHNRAFIGTFYLAAAYSSALSQSEVQGLFALGKNRQLVDYTTSAPTAMPTAAPTSIPTADADTTSTSAPPENTPTPPSGPGSTTTVGSSSSVAETDVTGTPSESAATSTTRKVADGPDSILLIAILLPLLVCVVCLVVAFVVRRRRRDHTHAALMSPLGSNGSSSHHGRSRRQSVSKRHHQTHAGDTSDGVYGAVLPALSGKQLSTYDTVSNYDLVTPHGGSNLPTMATQYDSVSDTVDRRPGPQPAASVSTDYDSVNQSINRRSAYDSIGDRFG